MSLHAQKIFGFIILSCAIGSYLLLSRFHEPMALRKQIAKNGTVQTNGTWIQNKNGMQVQNQKYIEQMYKQLCRSYQPSINIAHPPVQFDDISLVVTLNYDSVFKVIPLVEVMYRPFFPNLYYCAPLPGTEGLEYIEKFEREGWNFKILHPDEARLASSDLGKEWWWYLNYLCVDEIDKYHKRNESQAAKTGYLFIGDDLLISPVNLNKLSLKRPSRIAISRQCDLNGVQTNSNCLNWVHYPRAEYAKKQLLQNLGQQPLEIEDIFQMCLIGYQNITGFSSSLIIGSADIYFIPTHLMAKAVSLVKLYAQYGTILEVAVPEILECLQVIEKVNPYVQPTAAETIEGISDWTEYRNMFWMMQPALELVLDGTYHFLHPFKMSPLLDETPEAVTSFCQKVLPCTHQQCRYPQLILD